MRLANELAALAMDYTREHMRPGMKESEVGAMYEGFVHGTGVGYKAKSRWPAPSRWCGRAKESPRSPQPATARFRKTSQRSSKSGSARRLLDRSHQECLSR
jgi:hypothetical protein